MNGQMSLQGILVGESFATKPASMWAKLGMIADVALKIRFLREFPKADIAHMFLAAVDHFVHLKCVFVGKSFLANFTDVRFFGLVGQLVSLEVAFVGETLQANVANIWFHAGMDEIMFLKFVFCSEAFEADFARETFALTFFRASGTVWHGFFFDVDNLLCFFFSQAYYLLLHYLDALASRRTTRHGVCRISYTFSTCP